MRRAGLLVPIVIAVLFALATAASAKHASPAAKATLRVEVHPAVVRLGERATLAVSGVRARFLEVQLAGATDITGKQLPWRPLRFAGGAWVGTLPAPALLGVYPILLRTDAGEPAFGSRQLLRVFEPGTRARPSFDDPVDVVDWWVRAVAHGTLVALRAWPRPAFDRRDVRLHRRFVVAYALPGHPDVSDRLGMFVTAFREGYSAHWRLLGATVEP